MEAECEERWGQMGGELRGRNVTQLIQHYREEGGGALLEGASGHWERDRETGGEETHQQTHLFNLEMVCTCTTRRPRCSMSE